MLDIHEWIFILAATSVALTVGALVMLAVCFTMLRRHLSHVPADVTAVLAAIEAMRLARSAQSAIEHFDVQATAQEHQADTSEKIEGARSQMSVENGEIISILKSVRTNVDRMLERLGFLKSSGPQ